MSLTRPEWVEMWREVEKIEACAKQIINRQFDVPSPTLNAQRILKETAKMKEAIQSVIGQTE
jgi:hypothetical protein